MMMIMTTTMTIMMVMMMTTTMMVMMTTTVMMTAMMTTMMVSWAHFPVGMEKLMPFVDPDRIEQSDRVQAASFAPLTTTT